MKDVSVGYKLLTIHHEVVGYEEMSIRKKTVSFLILFVVHLLHPVDALLRYFAIRTVEESPFKLIDVVG